MKRGHLSLPVEELLLGEAERRKQGVGGSGGRDSGKAEGHPEESYCWLGSG